MKCRICGSEHVALTVRAKEMMIPTRDMFEYFECANCHCLQIAEVPDNLGDYYGGAYYSFADKDEPDHSAPILDMTPILDVGCGTGVFLKDLRKAGYGNLSGCDPFLEEDIFYGDEIHIYKRTIHEMDGQYERIFFNDSFEHVTDPHEVLESVYRLLTPKGLVRINIPVYPNIAFELFKEYWYQLDAPRHIYLHSEDSMHLLAKEHKFTIAKIEYNSDNTQLYRSYLYSQDIPFWEHTLDMVVERLGREKTLELKKIGDEANVNCHGDHAAFYLVKA